MFERWKSKPERQSARGSQGRFSLDEALGQNSETHLPGCFPHFCKLRARPFLDAQGRPVRGRVPDDLLDVTALHAD